MNYSALDQYEYKSPSFELNDRSYPVDPAYVENARFVYNEETGIYCSKAGAKDEISLLFAGDLLCQENMITQYQTEDGFDFSLCFEFIRPLLRSADFTAGNLETPVSHTAPYRGEIVTHEGPFYCNAPMQYIEALSYAGFDMLYTANNHTIDAGARGLMETIENARKFGMIQTGTFPERSEKFVIVDICGFRVGFTAFALTYNSMEDNMTQEGKDALLNVYSPENMQAIYDAMKEKGAEYTVCFPHWGKEYTDAIAEEQRVIAKTLVKIGYDLIAGSHSHVIQEATTIVGKPVLFSMGNLISHLSISNIRDITSLTVLYNLKLKRQGDRIIPEVQAIPCKIFRNYRRIPFTVLPAVECLDYSEKLQERMLTVAEDVAQRLKSKSLPVLTNYPVAESEIAAFHDAQEAIPKKVSALLCRQTTWFASKVKAVNRRLKRLQRKADRFVSSLLHTTEQQKTKPAYNKYEDPNHITARVRYLPSGTKVLDEGMFKDLTKLESLRMFNGLEIVKANAFENCTSLTGLIFPPTLETIEEHAFLGCCKLMSVKLPDSVTSIAENAFEGCSNVTIYCEQGTYADSYARKMQIPVKYMPLPRKADTAHTNYTAGTPQSTQNGSKKKLKRFAGPAVVIEDAEELDRIRKTLPAVKMGPMNGPNDQHPATIIATCKILGNPLPENATCGHQPSFYIHPKKFDGKRSTIIKLLGDHMPEMSSEQFEILFRRFRKKYQTQESLDRNAVDFTVYFCDWLLFAWEYGFSHDDYFDFEFYNKEPAIRETFVDKAFRMHLYNVCAKVVYRDIFKNKPYFLSKFSDFVYRDWLDTTTCTFEDFKAFAEKHDRFFLKPLGTCGGQGIHIMETSSDTLENLFKQCQEEEVLAEEIIVQHESLAAFNNSTLNTIRVLTVLDADDVPHVLLGVARFGRSGNVVDNFHGGGVGAIVDVETGIVITEAINQSHIRKPIHPDSKLPIIGFQYPEWEKIKETAKRAALMVPQVRNVGWDFAVNKNGDVEIVEGNSRSGFDVLQSPDQIGRKYLYDPYLPALEKMARVDPLVRTRGKALTELLGTAQPQDHK